jgi:hypothetical protein
VSYDPVYINADDAGNSIAFTTAPELKIETTGNVTNLATSGTTDFSALSDIVFEFNREIETVTKAELLYVRSGVIYATTVATSAHTLSPATAPTILTIPTTSPLAPGESFIVRLNVTSKDGQQLVYDDIEYGNPANFAGGVNNGDITFDVDSADVLSVTGTGKTFASAGALTAPSAASANTGSSITVDINHVVPVVPFDVKYRILRSQFQTKWVDTGVDYTINANTPSATTTTSVTLPNSSGLVYVTNTAQFKYRIQGIASTGYLSQTGDTGNIIFP